VCLVTAAVKTVRRLDLPARVLRYETALGYLAAGGMVVFLGGSASRVLYGGWGPRNLFHAGVIDTAGIAMMVATLAVAFRALHRARRGGLPYLTD
jgi:hypothetical protein